MISENEIRDILKIVRQLERVLEQALRTEQEKNESRVKAQLKASGINVNNEFIDTTIDGLPCICKSNGAGYISEISADCPYHNSLPDQFEL